MEMFGRHCLHFVDGWNVWKKKTMITCQTMINNSEYLRISSHFLLPVFNLWLVAFGCVECVSCFTSFVLLCSFLFATKITFDEVLCP